MARPSSPLQRWLGPLSLCALFVVAVGFELIVNLSFDPWEVGDLAVWARTGLLRFAWLAAATFAILAGRRRV